MFPVIARKTGVMSAGERWWGRTVAYPDRSVLILMAATLAASTGLYVVWPRAGVGLAIFVAIFLVPAIWLCGRLRPHAVVGAVLYLTILRPLPAASSTLVADRILDAVWLALFAAALAVIYTQSGHRLRLWRGVYWLAGSGALVGVSMVVGAVAGQNIVARDFFEFYRGPFYILVLLVATQVDWNRSQLTEYLFKPLLAALVVSAGVAILQMNSPTGANAVLLVYVPKVAEWQLSGFNFYARTSGTFTNPNWYGVALGLTLPVIWAGAMTLRAVRYLPILLIPVSSLIVLTGSRTAVLAVGFGVGVSVLLWLMRGLRRDREGLSAQMTKLTAACIVSAAAIFVAGVILSDRHHDTMAALARGLAGEVQGAADAVWPFNGSLDPQLGPMQARASLFNELRAATVDGHTNDSFDIKLDSSLLLVQEAWRRAPLTELGPSKSRGPELGDNQYSLTFYRYGIIGSVVWLGFWLSVSWRAARMWWGGASLEMTFGVATLAMVAVMLVSGLGGAFFDARPIAIVFLLLAGVAISTNSSPGIQHRRG